MDNFIEVILPLALPKTFTYKVSDEDASTLKSGMRIAVPFGKSKIFTALAIHLHKNPPTLYQAKEIHQILDEKPIVTSIQIQHWQWVAEYYMCTIGEVYRSALPSALLLESETIISLRNDVEIDFTNLSDDEFLIHEALQYQSSLKIQDVIAILNKKTVLPIIHRLLEKKIISLQEEIHEEYKPKLVRYIQFNDTYNNDEKLNELIDNQKSEKRSKLILSYFQLQASERKPITVKSLLDFSQISSSVLKALIEKEIFEEYFIQEDRINFEKAKIEQEIFLNSHQSNALSNIKKAFEEKEICLLHGVTASGKTEIYIKLIEEFINAQKQVLFLVPEIALTTQLVSRLTRYFGNLVTVFHSKYSNNERVEAWKNVNEKSQNARIIIGARSSIFLPFQDLGLIVVDEEHEQTYKQQEPSPRYHARDTAIVLSQLHGAKVLLGSATPSIETYFNVEQNKYALIEIKERFSKVQLPEIQLINLKDYYFRKKMKGHFSIDLIEAISEAFDNKEQLILFQNRRGYSPVMECNTCGHVPQCANCDVSLTYHKFKNQLRCHYCGYAIAKPSSCHACGSIDIETKGFGTEQIEIELGNLFPDKIIKRMDQDTTRGKHSFEKMIDGFKNREIDVLVGTQMLAKGLDFDNVSLVGILNADNMLYQPDFRAFERSFQMMTQVSGRAGRSEKRGKVIIQTYNPLHNIIQQVTHSDYISMYKEQLNERSIFKYPPYYRVIKIILKHKNFETLKNGATWLFQVLENNLKVQVLGPDEPAISRIKNEYIRNIIVKIPNDKSQQSTKKTIQKILNSFDKVSEYRTIKVTVNVDFY